MRLCLKLSLPARSQRHNTPPCSILPGLAVGVWSTHSISRGAGGERGWGVVLDFVAVKSTRTTVKRKKRIRECRRRETGDGY